MANQAPTANEALMADQAEVAAAAEAAAAAAAAAAEAEAETMRIENRERRKQRDAHNIVKRGALGSHNEHMVSCRILTKKTTQYSPAATPLLPLQEQALPL